jgi:aspartate kinase
MQTIVLKFGGAAVSEPERFHQIADIILARMRHYRRVAVVVSAMGNTTDQLIALAKQVHPNPPRREYDMLVTVGERISISLLAMALAAKNQEAVSFTGSQSGIITCGRHTDARIIDVKPFRLLPCLEKQKVVIVAGFQGVSQTGEITTLGRGGSDTSAVALGLALNAEKVEFYKDVEWIYNEDPKVNQEALPYEKLTYQQALAIAEKGAKVLQRRCIELAEKNALLLHVRSFLNFSSEHLQGTLIGDDRSRSASPIYEVL